MQAPFLQIGISRTVEGGRGRQEASSMKRYLKTWAFLPFASMGLLPLFSVFSLYSYDQVGWGPTTNPGNTTHSPLSFPFTKKTLTKEILVHVPVKICRTHFTFHH
jgi:hypothetical protein